MKLFIDIVTFSHLFFRVNTKMGCMNEYLKFPSLVLSKHVNGFESTSSELQASQDEI